MRVGILDLLGKEPPKNAYSRVWRANATSIMPQVVAVWCEQEGHDVSMAYYSGHERIAGALPDDLDLLFISAFSQAALVAYAFSQYFRSKGVVTVLGLMLDHIRKTPRSISTTWSACVTRSWFATSCKTVPPIHRLGSILPPRANRRISPA
jgi:hypothetical protein